MAGDSVIPISASIRMAVSWPPSVHPLLLLRTPILDLGLTQIQDDLILTDDVCQDLFQIRSHPEVLGRHELGGILFSPLQPRGVGHVVSGA